MKTIKMPREIGEKWLAALWSGKYKQGVGMLQNGGAFCCLGVLQMEVEGKTSTNEMQEEVPSVDWLQERGINFYASEGKFRPNPDLLTGSAAGLNDHGMSFSDIANEIEACMEYTDENV